MSDPKPKPCPECGEDDLEVDSAANAASWVECRGCEFKIQHACSEEAVIRRWNKLDRKTTKALSIRQPWAWLIIHGGKDVENRSWHTKYRGRFLVHAAKGMTQQEYADACNFCHSQGLTQPPCFDEMKQYWCGGIIGSVELVDSLDTSDSPWYMGEKAFLLCDPKPLAFTPLKGRLNFFDVSAELVTP